jgi:hypothetical protein
MLGFVQPIQNGPISFEKHFVVIGYFICGNETFPAILSHLVWFETEIFSCRCIKKKIRIVKRIVYRKSSSKTMLSTDMRKDWRKKSGMDFEPQIV